MSQQEEDKLDIIIKKLDKMERGLYGDIDNKVPGIMQSFYELKADVEKLKEHRRKAIWWGAGFITAMNAAAIYIFKKLGL